MSLRWPSVREVVGGVGAVAFALALVAAFAPDLLPASVTGVVAGVESAVEPWVVVLVLSLLVFAYAAYRFWRADDGAVERLVRDGDDAGGDELDGVSLDADSNRPGRDLDYAIARTVAQLEADPNADAWEADRVREDLEAAVVAVRTGAGASPDAVREAVAAGTWTDDRVAASFLGGPDAPSVSLWRRVYAWLYPARAFRRRVERVVTEVERQAGVYETNGRDDDAPAGEIDGDVAARDGGDAAGSSASGTRGARGGREAPRPSSASDGAGVET